MLQKLFQAKRGLCLLENPDAIMSQELLIGGHLYLKVMNIIFCVNIGGGKNHIL